jgi:hypothetical protein
MATRAQRVATQRVIDKLMILARTYDSDIEYFRDKLNDEPDRLFYRSQLAQSESRAAAYRTAADIVRAGLLEGDGNG